MAAASVTNPGANFSVVDSSRLAQVATWPPTWSPGRSVEQVVDDIAPGGVVPTVEGRRISITVDNEADMDRDLAVEVRFGSRAGVPLKVYLGPYPPGESHQVGPGAVLSRGLPAGGHDPRRRCRHQHAG